MKKISVSMILCLCIISLCFFNINAVGECALDRAHNWYCIRNKEHKQPLPDANMKFIEEYGGYYVDRGHNDDSEEKVVYLTFDAGYENGNIARILDMLKQEKVPAAFFVLSNLIIKEPNLIIRMTQEGHLVCNHTSKHADITKYESKEMLKKDLQAIEDLYKEVTKKEMPKYFRPPEGRFSERSMRYLSELGYKTIFWSFAYADWDNDRQMSEHSAMEKIMSNHHNGEVMLLHPTSSTNAKILGDVICRLRNEGYRFGSLDELK